MRQNVAKMKLNLQSERYKRQAASQLKVLPPPSSNSPGRGSTMKNSMKSPPESPVCKLIINESREDEVTKANPGKESIEEMVRVDHGTNPIESNDAEEVKSIPPMSPVVKKRTSPPKIS